MQRRIFIRNVGWIAGGLLVGCNKKVYSGTEGGKLLKGHVKSGNKGIANVVVSDGYSVVVTNNKGAYEFEKHADATSVFISTPSGYAFKHENGTARHYRLFSDLSNKDVNFDRLIKMMMNTSSLSGPTHK
jgi:hypothetical protein